MTCTHHIAVGPTSRRTRWFNRSRILLGAAIAVATLAGCGAAPRYQYLTDGFSGTIVQIPAAWTVVNGEAILAVTAQRVPDADNAVLSRYIEGFSAADNLDPAQLLAATNAVPSGYVRSRYLLTSELQHGMASNLSVRDLLDQLNDLSVLPADATITVVRSFGVVTDSGANGVGYELRLEYGDGGVATVSYVVVGDVARGVVNTLVIGCSAGCYETERAAIERVVDSFTVVDGQVRPRR